MRDVIELFSIIVGVVFCILLSTFLLILGFNYIDCSALEKTGYKTQFYWGKCMVQVDGKYVPKEYVFGNVNEFRVKGEMK